MMLRHRGLLYLTPFLLPLLAYARPTPQAGTTLSVPINSKAQAADGSTYTLTGTLSLQIDAPAPIPTPDPLAISSVTVDPGTVFQGAGATGTITLNRAPAQPVQVPVVADNKLVTVASPVTINTGQSSGTFAIGTGALANADLWLTLTASYNGQSKAASLLVRANPIPTPTPTPTPTPGPGGVTVTGYTDASGAPLISGSPGQAILIHGRGFGSTPGIVQWNGTQATVTAWSDTQIAVTLPVVVPGPAAQSVLVARPDGGYYTGMIVGPVPGRRR
jgi:hypothetical protein